MEEKELRFQGIRTMSLSVKLAIFFLLAVIASIAYDKEFGLIAITYYFGLSTVTFIFYAWDKRSAIKGHWRIAENTLHLLALVGGWPGALIAQAIFRHKTQKQPFKAILWLTVLLNTGVFIYVFVISKNSVLKWLNNLFAV